MAKKPPYGNSPGPKTPYAQDNPPLIINRNQRKQLNEIGMAPEPVNPRPTPKPPPAAPVAPPPQRDINRQREVAERLRKRQRTLDNIR